MVYRYLGNTGLRVSVLSLGNWLNGNVGETDLTDEIVKAAWDNGINFFDTAEIYGFGEAEKSFGRALKKLNVRREELVVSTKVFRSGFGVNDTWNSRKHIVEGIENSLKRLQLDYVDVYFCHRFDPVTPLEETCRAMDYVVQKGRALYWGTSEWKPEQIMEAYAICDRLGLVKPIAEQCQYNMIARDGVESKYTYLFNRFKYGTTIWSPLFSGVLTGKYINEVPKGSRLDAMAQGAKTHYNQYMNSKATWDEKLLKLKDIAEKLGCTLAQLAVVWVIKNPDVSTCILGASRPQQIAENVEALKFLPLYTNDIETQVDEILGNAPQKEIDWSTFNEMRTRRNILFGIDPEKK